MDHDKQNPPTDEQTDLTKAQNQQQPPEGQSQQQPPEGQADFGTSGQPAGQSDTITEQRSDIESGTATGQASDDAGSTQFVGAKGATDTSSEFVEDDDDFAKDRRGDGE